MAISSGLTPKFLAIRSAMAGRETSAAEEESASSALARRSNSETKLVLMIWVNAPLIRQGNGVRARNPPSITLMFAERSAFTQEYFKRFVLSGERAWLATIVATSYTEKAEIPKRPQFALREVLREFVRRRGHVFSDNPA